MQVLAVEITRAADYTVVIFLAVHASEGNAPFAPSGATNHFRRLRLVQTIVPVSLCPVQVPKQEVRGVPVVFYDFKEVLGHTLTQQ